MTINNENKFHGYVVSEIFKALSFDVPNMTFRIVEYTRSAYVLEVYKDGKVISCIGLYLKYRTSRRSPWRHIFMKEHQEAIDELFRRYGKVFVLLVNGDDGVACIDHDFLKQLLDENFEEVEWVSVRRELKTRYALKGKDGELKGKIALNQFPRAIVAAVKAMDARTESY